MNWAEAIVVVILALSLAKVVNTAIHARSGADQPAVTQQPDDALQTQALRREVADLRERVRVLERIATDGRESRDLADEIERLR